MSIATFFTNAQLSDAIRHQKFLFTLLLIVFSNLGYAGTSQHAVHPIIEVATLQARLAQSESDLLLVDVRDGETYQTGHLPGAINLPVEHTFNLKGDHTRIASLEQIRELLSHAGIRNSDYLVLYDDGTLKDAAHVFWVLETYGHKKISVLDGGLAAWQAQHDEITTIDNPLPRSEYIPNIATHRLSTELAVLLGIRNDNVEIIDARAHKEYLGLTSSAKRKGHIPNAISIPWNANLVKNAKIPTLKSKPVLRALYHDLDKKQKVIAYCNRGKESAVTYLVLRDLGYNVSVYDGAWLEWGNDDNLPIAIGTRLSGDPQHAH